MSDTRVTQRLRVRVRPIVRQLRNVPPVLLATLLVVGAATGFIAGRITAVVTTDDAVRLLEQRVLPLAIDADGVWSSGSDDRTPVADGLVALRRAGDASIVAESSADWLVAYDAILLQMAGVDLPAVARPIQRQFISAVMLSRDAVELLEHAAGESGETRAQLLIEVGRLRQRSEQLTQAARASVADLAGQRADVAPPAPISGF